MERIYIFKSGRLKRKENTLIFEYLEDEVIKKKFLPVENISEIYLFGEIDLNTKALNFLSQKGIVVHYFNYYGFYSGSILPRKKNVSGYLVVNQAKHYLDPDRRLILAISFVDGAAFHIGRNLRKRGINTDYVEELSKTIYEQKNIPSLMSIEGKIREFYYSKFADISQDEFFRLEKREKRPPTNAINALISYGNSLMYSTVLSEIYKTQLDPTISYLHEPSTSRFSLSLDISEIFKPLVVDPIIFSLINKKIIGKDDFDRDLNYAYLSETGRKKFVKAFNDRLNSTIKHRKLRRKVSYRYLIRLECYKLIKHLIGDELYIPLKAWW
ncbi:type I-B CRISPR-associated endonuclease Cas1b [Desulfurobacterium thermolithotrophum]|uniref:type I-B CRISPR-associated endonuclease Cas1b n=1 Tax=Desulfurobacterium thermolithotrophum TaxID=64160 RepID=UPI0013CFEAEB|nr:type I-B CRISPR-associated endonuclease Cas1b [Desulfurobacterium thermolithotrophum]